MDLQEEVVPGLSVADVKCISDQIFNRKDGNHQETSGFLDIMEKGEPDISTSSIFIDKVSL